MTNLDQVTLVNSHDEVLGVMDKIEAHRGEAQLHRAISVYLFQKDKETGTVRLLIQQRSAQKIVGAYQWANTVCGNVWPTENYQECAYRRLKDELGITSAQLKPLHKFEYHLQCNEEFSEWEIDQVFVGWYDDEVQPNPDEVQNYAWVDWSELHKQSQKAKLQTQHFNTKEVALTSYHLHPTSIILAPWFVWMLNDEILVKNIDQYVKS